MRKVITYGTFDLFHRGHQRLLERARELGDYLVVGVTSDDFDRVRGKANVQQSLVDRLEAVRATGLADEVIVEEYVGQKIDDIKRLGIDVFTVGSDWVGYFDYLRDYCEVVYLDRTQGVSSSELRSERLSLKLGLVGGSDGYEVAFLEKLYRESQHVNGVDVTAVCLPDPGLASESLGSLSLLTEDYDELLASVDAVFVVSHPRDHGWQIRKALAEGVHVLCEEPISLDEQECEELFDCASSAGLVLTGAVRTAYCTAFDRLLLQVQSGKIGKVVSVDARCTSLREFAGDGAGDWGSFFAWGATACLPVIRLLGPAWSDVRMSTLLNGATEGLDRFTRLSFTYPSAVAGVTVAKGAKSEGDLVISGTKGYAYVPAPWWKTDYFELRYEDPGASKRFFYQLDGEGIRNELVAFARAVGGDESLLRVDRQTSKCIAGLTRRYLAGEGVEVIG